MNKRSVEVAVCGVAGLLGSAGAFAAEAFTKGTGALQVFDGEAFAAASVWAQLWLIFLITTFLAGLVFFARSRPIARWAAGGFLLSMSTGHMVFAALGLPMLSGAIAIWHLVCWSPALLLLLSRRPFLDAKETRWFRLWSGVMTAVILISFVFDIRDAAIYIEHFSHPSK